MKQSLCALGGEMEEMGITYGRDAAALYQSALRRVIGKAHEERAKFPLEITVRNAEGAVWSAVVTLKDGMIACKHRQDTVSLTFPRHLVVIDARNDRVASMDVMVPGPFPPLGGGVN
jgi:hypothetical protein